MAYELPPCTGKETVTTGCAWASVSCFSCLPVEARVAMPRPTTMRAIAAPTAAVIRSPRWRAGGFETSDDMGFSDEGRNVVAPWAKLAVHDTEHDRHEDQRRKRGKGQSA